ncbi:hypothetical protein V500_05859 [Pseudogymnoascus sp. VKM F-4518 (FW-2643)]|nr:hypothetical protein V500_05859 [Pseudogymnoascus sp. VKM F-4518 (FW-2643)]
MKYTLSEGRQTQEEKSPKARTGARTQPDRGVSQRCGEKIFKEGEQRNETEATQVLGGFGREHSSWAWTGMTLRATLSAAVVRSGYQPDRAT